MQKFENNIQDQFGNKITGLTVEVRNVVGGALSSIFSDDGVTPKANPFVEATSEFFFYADNGRYDIFISGAESDSFLDVLLFDGLAGGGGNPANTPFGILADIVTATPPTTEGVTARLEYRDLDDDDLLSYSGFSATNGFEVAFNQMRGGFSYLRGTDTAGGVATYMQCEPEGVVLLTFPGFAPKKQKLPGLLRRFTTAQEGIEVYGSFDFPGDPTLTEAQGASVDLMNNSGTRVGTMGFDYGSANIVLYNNVYEGRVEFWTTDNVGASVSQLTINPFGASAGIEFFMQGAGRVINFPDEGAGGEGRIDITGGTTGNGAEIRYVDNILTPVERFVLGYSGTNIFTFTSRIHGGSIFFVGEDAGGAPQDILHMDPDNSVDLFYAGVSELETTDHSASQVLTGARVKDSLGNFQPVGIATSANFSPGGSGTPFSKANYGKTINCASGSTQTTYSNVAADQLLIPDGTMWPVENNSGGTVTLAPGTGVTLIWMDGAGGATGSRTLADGASGVLRKVNNTEYRWVGNGTT